MNNKIILQDFQNVLSEDIDWKSLKGATVLVTGATGLLASYIVEFLLFMNCKCNANITILAISRSIDKLRNAFADYLHNDYLILRECDVNNDLEYTGNVNYVIHAAGNASPVYFGKDPVGTALGHSLGTAKMLNFAHLKKVNSFIYFSSCAVYGLLDSGAMADEKYIGAVDNMDIRECYAEGKRMGEYFCKAYSYQYNVPVKIARIAHTYSPKMRLDDGRVYADFVNSIVNNKNILLNSTGDASRSMLYITDAIKAYFRILLCGKNGDAYNVVSDEYIKIIDLARMLVNMVPEKKLSVCVNSDAVAGYIKSAEIGNRYSNSKIKALGWKQQYSIHDGFRRVLDYLLD